jgi:hypothetical protein
MTNPVPNLPHLPGLAGSPAVGYPPDSRYAQTGTAATTTLPDGRTVTYLRRRFVPDTSSLPTIAWHEVTAVERLDLLAARYYGDSQLWWLIADANGATDPDELLVPGRRIRIAHPQGFGGVPL